MAIDFKSLPDPKLRYDVMTNRFVLLEDYITPEITIPAGEFTDGASRPELVNLACKQYDRSLPACLIHDYMYRNAIILPGYENNPKLGADELFGKNLKRVDFAEPKIDLMVNAVKIFGKGNY